MRKRKIISLDVDSALVLMQEIYNDVTEQRSTASLITKKMLTFMKDAEDMTVIGPVIKDQQKILNDCIEKKISLVKLQGILLKQTTSTGKTQGGGFSKISLTDDDKKILEQYMNEDEGNEKDTYKS